MPSFLFVEHFNTAHSLLNGLDVAGKNVLDIGG